MFIILKKRSTTRWSLRKIKKLWNGIKNILMMSEKWILGSEFAWNWGKMLGFARNAKPCLFLNGIVMSWRAFIN